MDRGTYAAASGGLMQFRKLEVVTNNLANVNSPGFKRQALQGEVQTFDQTLASIAGAADPFAKGDHDRVPGVVDIDTVTDFSVGAIRATGNPLDVALRNANDFFVVQTPEGTRYTRAGNFSLAAGGQLVTADGLEVQGDGGPISVGEGKVEIGPDGGVLVDGVAAGRLQVARFDEMQGLERVGGNLFAQGSARAPTDTDPDVVPQSLEMSNVSTISAVVDLMTASRGFQMYTKTAETLDQMNQTAINQYGRRVR